MSNSSIRTPKRSRLTAALLAALVIPAAGAAFAQETETAPGDQAQATNLGKVTVTGSLIPQTEIETVTPVTIITAEDIHARGFNNIAEVLQSNSFASGGIQGGETSASFTQGAEAVSMFGLDPGYTKYLINGRPMSNYPALYNGSDVFNNISGIPLDVVERIEILPGGSSSLYGSDALAGVVNFILKKDYVGTTVRVRGGAYTEGGGSSFRASVTNGFTAFDERLNVITSLQYETRDPIWGYQRDLTDSVNQHGYTAPVASRDYLVYGLTAASGFRQSQYFLPDGANNCEAIKDQFGGTEDLQNRPGSGEYCGSIYSPGYRTIRNGKDSGQLYSRASFDVNDNLQLYGELLYSNERAQYATGSNYTWWGTGSKYGYFYDPQYDALINLQRAFSPEDIGGEGYGDIMNTNQTDSYTVTFGGSGYVGENWDYDVSFTRNESELKTRGFDRFADPINAYFEQNVLGPELGVDPFFGVYPMFSPDYAAFYSQMDPRDFASFTGYTMAKAHTWDNLFRAQVTNSDLFSLPGGAAGLAAAIEAGSEGWDYTPDPRSVPDPVTLESETWGSTDVGGAGHRTKYAAMAELRLPFLDMLTASLSARYDAFDNSGVKVDKPTWSAGLEFRPFDTLLLRGKYSTAFKAPTLADTNQGLSGYYSRNVDYYRCSLPSNGGYTPGNTDDCGFNNVSYFGTQSGNPDLDPINANVWNAGFVWAPINNLSLSVDYFKWDIEDEVDQLDADQVLLQEYYCRSNLPSPGITSCDNALNWVQRGPTGALISVYTPKVNIAQQKLDVITASAKYLWDIGRFGVLAFTGNYTQTPKHEVTTAPGEEPLDLINSPNANWIYDAGPKYKADASVSWSIGKWNSTLYANQLGATPNYLAYLNDTYDYTNAQGVSAGKWGSYTTYNLGVDYAATDHLKFTVQVNNLGNKSPDYQAHNYPGTATVPYNNYIYSANGRAIYLEARYDFGGATN